MSVEAISWVLNESATGGTAKVLLIGVANWVDRHGRAFVGVPKLAEYAQRDVRNVRRILQGLVDDAHLGVLDRQTEEPLDRVPSRGMLWELIGWQAPERAKPRGSRAKPRGHTSLSDPLLDPPSYEALELPLGTDEEEISSNDSRVAEAAWLEARKRLALRDGPPLKFPERRWLTRTFNGVLEEIGMLLEAQAALDPAASPAELLAWATEVPPARCAARPVGCAAEGCDHGWLDDEGGVRPCPTCRPEMLRGIPRAEEANDVS